MRINKRSYCIITLLILSICAISCATVKKEALSKSSTTKLDNATTTELGKESTTDSPKATKHKIAKDSVKGSSIDSTKDSTKDSTIDLSKNSILKEYLTSLEPQPNDTILFYINDLIKRSNPNNDTTKSKKNIQALIAFNAYNHFYNSPIMGKDEVAIRVAQEWFLNKKLEWPNKEGLFMVNMFVEMNKHSLIGMKAPELNLTDTLGERVSLNSQPPLNTIIYFFTDDCITCKVETPKLVNFVNEYTDAPLNVYAVYTQSNRERWIEYVNKNFSSKLYNPFVNWINVYDPEFESGFHMLYNVISTPQMFLLSKDKTIIGRNINTETAAEILEGERLKSEKMRGVFTQILSGAKDSISVNSSIDLIYNKSSKDTLLFKELFSELFDFLRYSDNYLLQDGAEYLANRYIVDKEDIWSNDRYIDDVRKWLEIYNMNPLGGVASNLELEEIGGSPINLSDIKSEYKVLYFYKIDCGVCTHVSKELDSLYKVYKPQLKDNLEFVAINTGKEYNEWVKYISNKGYEWLNVWGGEYRDKIYEKYYLESVPAIYLLKDNMVIAKDITDLDLAEVLQIIKVQAN